MGANCDLDPASSHAGICHMAEDRRMSGQNSDRKRESQFGNLEKMSVNVLSYDMCQTRHQLLLTLLLTDLLKLPRTSPKVAYSENSYTLCKLLS